MSSRNLLDEKWGKLRPSPRITLADPLYAPHSPLFRHPRSEPDARSCHPGNAKGIIRDRLKV
jgi:hypothetical protein